MGYADAKRQATSIQAEDLLHLGGRAAVGRALSRLARSEQLMRVCRGTGRLPKWMAEPPSRRIAHA